MKWRYLRFDKIQDGGWRPSWIYKNGHKFETGVIDVMFGSSIRFSQSADLMVQLSMTLSDPEPQFQGHSIVQRRISRKLCIRSTPCLVLGKGFRGQQIEWCYFWYDSIQDGGWRPSWNDARNPCDSWAFLVVLADTTWLGKLFHLLTTRLQKQYLRRSYLNLFFWSRYTRCFLKPNKLPFKFEYNLPEIIRHLSMNYIL